MESFGFYAYENYSVPKFCLESFSISLDYWQNFCSLIYFWSKQNIRIWFSIERRTPHYFWKTLVCRATFSLWTPGHHLSCEWIRYQDIKRRKGDMSGHINGGFENTFRGVVSHGSNPILVFNTWNSLRHQGSIKSYDLSLDSGSWSASSPATDVVSRDNTTLDYCRARQLLQNEMFFRVWFTGQHH